MKCPLLPFITHLLFLVLVTIQVLPLLLKWLSVVALPSKVPRSEQASVQEDRRQDRQAELKDGRALLAEAGLIHGAIGLLVAGDALSGIVAGGAAALALHAELLREEVDVADLAEATGVGVAAAVSAVQVRAALAGALFEAVVLDADHALAGSVAVLAVVGQVALLHNAALRVAVSAAAWTGQALLPVVRDVVALLAENAAVGDLVGQTVSDGPGDTRSVGVRSLLLVAGVALPVHASSQALGDVGLPQRAGGYERQHCAGR